MRLLGGLLVFVVGCSGTAAPVGFAGDAGHQARDAGEVVDAAAPATDAGTVKDASEPDVIADAHAADAFVDPDFDQPCQQLTPPASDCGNNTQCIAGYTGDQAGVDGGVQMHDRCSWKCASDTDCGDVHFGGSATPGSQCVPVNDGAGHISMGVCAPPP